MRVAVVLLCALMLTSPVYGQLTYQNGAQESFNIGWLFARGEQNGASSKGLKSASLNLRTE